MIGHKGVSLIKQASFFELLNSNDTKYEASGVIDNCCFTLMIVTHHFVLLNPIVAEVKHS